MGIRGSVDRSSGSGIGGTSSATTTSSGGVGTLAGIYDITASPYNASTAATDNTAAIQAAINAAKANGGKVYVPPGVFKFASPLHCEGQSLGYSITGASGGVGEILGTPSELRYTGSGSAAAITCYSVASFAFEGIRFTYTSTSFTGDLIDFDGFVNHSDCTNWRIVGCSSMNLGASRTARSIIRLSNVINGAIYDCGWAGAVNNLRIGEPGGYVVGVQIENCTFNYSNDAMILFATTDGENLVINNCRFEASTNTTAIRGITVAAGDGSDNSLYNPVITNNWFGDASATTIWIDGVRSNGNAGTIAGNRMANVGPAGVHCKVSGSWFVAGNGFEGGTAFDSNPIGGMLITSVGNYYNCSRVFPASYSYVAGQPGSFTSINDKGTTPETVGISLADVGIGVRSNAGTFVTTGLEDLLITSQVNAGFTAVPSNKAVIYKGTANAVPSLMFQSPDNGADGQLVFLTGATPTEMMRMSRAKLSFFAAAPVAQAARAGQLTDSTGGTVSSTLAAGIADATAKNAIASLAAKVNALETIIHNLGLSA